MRPMSTRRTVPVEIDATTVALVELAAQRDGVTVSEWISRAARDEYVRGSRTEGHVEPTEAEAVQAEHELAEIEAAERFRAAG